MHRRCYNPKADSYRFYGAVGVTVHEDWHTLDGFLSTVDFIEGWDLNKFLDGDLTLDKDIKSDSKVYSVETCKWVSQTENSKKASMGKVKIYAVSPTGAVLLFNTLAQLTEAFNVTSTVVYTSIRKGTTAKGTHWQFFRDDIPIEGIKLIRAEIEEQDYLALTRHSLNALHGNHTTINPKSIAYGLNTKYGEELLRSKIRMTYVHVTYEAMVKSLTTIESSTSTERVQGIISQYMTKRVEYTPLSVEMVGDLE